jgi:CO dehydrogenase/acetyl-CoA synthase gamma subunit (corrinoid Fe-S protein)
LGGSVYTTKKNTETLVVASKEIGLKEMLKNLSTYSSPEIINSGRSRYIKIGNSTIEMVEEFRYLVKNLTNRKSIRKKLTVD